MADTIDLEGNIVPPEKVDEFTLKPVGSGKDCDKVSGGWGNAMNDYEYIWYGNLSEEKYPKEACTPYYHSKAKVDYLKINTELNGNGDININGNINTNANLCGATVCATVKLFDISHPTKQEKRLIHACLEGPENGVYIRGRITNQNVIEVPEYWSGLVDSETITVTLTQIGYSQDLIVEKIEWGKKIYIKSGNGANIDCYYIVNATRKDVPPLEVEQDA
jgi:hypothetical protein